MMVLTQLKVRGGLSPGSIKGYAVLERKMDGVGNMEL